MRDAASVLSAVIPELSFDLIGRVIPGTLVLLAWAAVHLGVDGLAERLENVSGLGALLAVVLGYITAFILMGLWSIPEVVRTEVEPEYRPDLNKPDESLQTDAAHILSPAAGARLVKQMAECNAGRVLCAGWLLAAFYNQYVILFQCLVAAHWTPGTLYELSERLLLRLVLTLGAAGAWFFQRHMQAVIEEDRANYWYILYERRASFRPPGER